MHCEDCAYKNSCHSHKEDITLVGCTSGKPQEAKTNADMIRGMTDRELAEFLIVCSEESRGYEYINAFDGQFSLGGICESREEAIEKQLEWLNSEVME